MNKKLKIKVEKDGPYIVDGNLPLQDEKIVSDPEGYPLKWKAEKKYEVGEHYHLCRCGHSKNKPFCDGSHKTSGVDCTETADNIPFDEQADVYEGEALKLKDAGSFCAGAKFCDRASGVWDSTENSADPDAKKIAIEEACNCPSGRLVEIDKKTGQAIEPKLEKSISVTRDENNQAGPLWVKGGVEIESADGEKYETRNRATLCRCGKSRNKPFCDGSHQL